MRFRKTVLYLLLLVLGLILAYNYMIAPVMMQNNVEMGMGMHWRMYSSTNYIIDARIILIIAIVIAALLIFELIKPINKQDKCPKCSTVIEDGKWKICPNCGNKLNNRKG
jgi:rRNA maturation endonuclease Nob1